VAAAHKLGSAGPGEPDVEARAGPADHDALRLWLRLLATTTLIEKRVRRLLLERFQTTLPRFDLMAQLYRVPAGLKMSELSRRMMVTGGNVTGITDLLERDGLVRRSEDPRDRRASRVSLTPPGRRAFRLMAEQHESWIIEALAGVSPAELRELAGLLGRVKDAVRAAEARHA
jgi:DNA-binding MarR family transcriptional regulator